MGLFKPIWMRDDLIRNGNRKKFDKAYEVVSNMTDQDELRRVVLEATHETLASKALERIDDEVFLGRIAQGHDRTRTKGAFFHATRKVHDQDVLGQIALSGAENAAIAVENVVSQAMLVRVARGSQSGEARLEAMRRIDAPAEIVSVAVESGDPKLAAQAWDLARRAIARCADARKLEGLALDVDAPEFAHIPERAVARAMELEGVDAAVRIAMDPRCGETAASEATRAIKDDDLLLGIARNAPSKAARDEAVRHLCGAWGYSHYDHSPEVEEFYVEMALSDSDHSGEAASYVSGQEALARIAREAPRADAKRSSVRSLDDLRILSGIALSDPDVCTAAVERIWDMSRNVGTLLFEQFDAGSLAARDDISQPQRDELCRAIVWAAQKLEDPAERLRASELFAASALPVLQAAAEEVGCDHDFVRSTENLREDKENRYRYYEIWQTCSKCGKRELVTSHEVWGDEHF